MLNYTPNIPRTTIPPGDYTARVYAKGFTTISDDGRFGNDLHASSSGPATSANLRSSSATPAPSPAAERESLRYSAR
ncbi:hypothetical protein ABZU76_33990 [Amycolatopsis sp. NPDC005232]|uniref:hypothetical protein n=1 Tax=Amycolatopsis sp. NPDC005232 TaxID=3157027 RepID=UPI0033B54F6B